MTKSAAGKIATVPIFSFFKGPTDVLAPKTGEQFDWEQAASKVREQLGDALNAQNLSFLFGSGTSSYVQGGDELGIPTMGPLAKEFLAEVATNQSEFFLTAEERTALVDVAGIDLGHKNFSANLERLMETLFSFQFALGYSTTATAEQKAIIDTAIEKIIRFVRSACTEGKFSEGDDTVLKIYQSFYRRLLYRERTRARPWIFTTNYDLFNETAMDRLGVPYANGFMGSVERRFNPATYRYSLAEQLDISSQKWSAVDGFVHLCKLHGSVNWVEDGRGFFRVREAHASENVGAERVMIYPTPGKQNASFGSPYVDLFREFQMRVVREQSVLIVVGYSFGDEHINNLIFQALTIPSFRLIVLASPEAGGVIAKLREIGDPRIWIIGGDGPLGGVKAHYFQTVVEKFMPQLPGEKVDQAVEAIIATFAATAERMGTGGETE